MMWKILGNCTFPINIVNVISETFSSSKNRVKLGEALSEAFYIKTGKN